jgi:hypothetical protein
MCTLKKLMLNLFFAGAIALPAGLYGQDNSMQSSGTDSLGNNYSTGQSKEMNSTGNNAYGKQETSTDFTPNQIDQALARLNEKPDDNVKTELEGVAEKQARDLQAKVGFDDDSYSDIKDAINNYLEEGWQDRVELAQKAGDPDAYKDKSADLAYSRVDLAEKIKDEIGDDNASKWNSNAVDFWTSLDQADFYVKAKEAGIAAGSENSGMNQDKMNQKQMNMNNQQNMNNNQQNMNGSQNNTDQNTDQNNTDQNGASQTNPDQGQSTDNQNNQ